jgi:hypothetical protein
MAPDNEGIARELERLKAQVPPELCEERPCQRRIPVGFERLDGGMGWKGGVGPREFCEACPHQDRMTSIEIRRVPVESYEPGEAREAAVRRREAAILQELDPEPRATPQHSPGPSRAGKKRGRRRR